MVATPQQITIHMVVCTLSDHIEHCLLE